MKHALLVGIFTLGLTTGAIAQSPTDSGPSGPHDPNPPMNAPDLRLPPCGGGAPDGTQIATNTTSALPPSGTSQGDRVADTECASNSNAAPTTSPAETAPAPK